jgi:methylmalonyl-CoA mutase N-terminal domain/subunit
VEAGAEEYLDQIQELGGAAKAVEFMKEEIHQAAYRFQLQIESGDRTVVGVNAFVEEEGDSITAQPDYPALEKAQKARLETLKAGRDEVTLRHSLEAIQAAARSGENLLPPLIEAAKNRVTLGEISDLLREEWGSYDRG